MGLQRHNHPTWQLFVPLAMAVLLCATTLLWAPLVVASEEDGIVLGVFPRRPALMTQTMFTPLAKELSEQLGIAVTLEVPPDFSALWEGIQEGRYDLLHYNPYQYLRAQQRYSHRLIAMSEEDGSRKIRSAIWVRKDSGIRNINALRHRKIVFGGGRDAMASYIMATDLLLQAGLRQSDYITQFTINPSHALRALFYHQGQAAGFHGHHIHNSQSENDLDMSQLTQLVVSEPVAHHPWAVSPNIDNRLETRIKLALFDLKESASGRAALAKTGLSGIGPANDSDYDPHRRIIARVLGENY